MLGGDSTKMAGLISNHGTDIRMKHLFEASETFLEKDGISISKNCADEPILNQCKKERCAEQQTQEA